jgi:hypothetical protein
VPLAPRSGARVGTNQPTFRWELPTGATGATLEICADVACAKPEVTAEVMGASYAAAAPLARGVHYWRLTWIGAPPSLVRSGTLSFVVGTRTTAHDTSFEHRFDLDGDGYPDVVVGAPGKPGQSPGFVTIFPGGPDGIDPARSEGTTGLSASNTGLTLSGGDLDSDGRSDLIAGSHGGHAYLAQGRAPASIVFDVELDSLGPSLGVSVADIDGFSSGPLGAFAVGASIEMTTIPRVFLYAPTRDAHGFIARPTRPALFADEAGAEVTLTTIGTSLPAADGSLFGATLANAGDLDGDGLTDLLIGAPGAGKAYVSGSGWSFAFPLGAGAGRSLDCAGDVDADGLSDVIIGDPDAEEASVVLGSASRQFSVAVTLHPDQPGEGFATSVAGAGDVNGDGFEDIVVGAPKAAGLAGKVYLFLGSDQGISATPSLVLTGDVSGGAFGAVVTGVSDVNGDGFDDVAVGVPGGNGGQGAVVLFRGTPTGLEPTPWVTLTGVGEGFGAAILGL